MEKNKGWALVVPSERDIRFPRTKSEEKKKEKEILFQNLSI